MKPISEAAQTSQAATVEIVHKIQEDIEKFTKDMHAKTEEFKKSFAESSVAVTTKTAENRDAFSKSLEEATASTIDRLQKLSLDVKVAI